jgi:hypothetical protein
MEDIRHERTIYLNPLGCNSTIFALTFYIRQLIATSNELVIHYRIPSDPWPGYPAHSPLASPSAHAAQ